NWQVDTGNNCHPDVDALLRNAGAGRSRDALVVAPRPASSVANHGTGQLVPEVRTAAGRTAGGLTPERSETVTAGTSDRAGRASCGTQTLLFSHVCQCEPRRGGDRVQHWMQGVHRHAQLVSSFPCTNAQVRGIHGSIYLCHIRTPAFLTLELLNCPTFAITRQRFAADRPRCVVVR